MTFRSLETRCKSPYPSFCFRNSNVWSTSLWQIVAASLMGARQSKRPSRPPRPRAHVRFDDFEILRAIGRGAFGKVCFLFYFHILNHFTMSFLKNSSDLFTNLYHENFSTNFFSGWAVEKEAKLFIVHKQFFSLSLQVD